MKSMSTKTQQVKRKKEQKERQRQQKLNNSVKKKVEHVKTKSMATIPEHGNALLMTPALPNPAPRGSTGNGLTLHGETKAMDRSGLPEWANDTDSDMSEMSTASGLSEGLSEGSGIPNSPSSASSPASSSASSSASSPASSMSTPSAAFTSPRVSFGTPSVSSTPPLYPEEPAKEEQTTPEIQISGFIFRYRDHSVRMALNKVK